ncbi:transposase [Nostoc sp.]|uniref:transposase n=1 Tax=Nostoc sp. TaxID=1180 RepID=UPI003FA60C24
MHFTLMSLKFWFLNFGRRACVVMDNFSSHKIKSIQEAIESVGARLVYLSPYSPDFSPIENCWSKVKEFLRSQAARTYLECDLNDNLAKRSRNTSLCTRTTYSSKL